MNRYDTPPELQYGTISEPSFWDQLSAINLPFMGVFGDIGDWVQGLNDITGFTGLRNITDRAMNPSVMNPGAFSLENIMDSVDAASLITDVVGAGPALHAAARPEVGDALAPQFLDRWGIKEGPERVLPGLPSFVEDARKRVPFSFGE